MRVNLEKILPTDVIFSADLPTKPIPMCRTPNNLNVRMAVDKTVELYMT